jgi:hypothetical protein
MEAVGEVTVTVEEAELRLVPDAVMRAVPVATPVTGTAAVVAPARIVTEAGTVAAAVLPEARATVTPPAGAATDSVTVRFWVAPAVTERVEDVNESAPLTETDCVAEV